MYDGVHQDATVYNLQISIAPTISALVRGTQALSFQGAMSAGLLARFRVIQLGYS